MNECETPLILFDSECPQCSWFIQQLCKKPQNSDLRFTSLYGKTATELYKEGRLHINPKEFDLMIVINQNETLSHWNALLFCLERLPVYERLSALLKRLPLSFGKTIYSILVFARNITRKKKVKICSLESFDPERFLP